MFLLMTDALEELRELIDRHARPDETTAIDGVLLSRVTQAGEPAASRSGTVLAVIAQGEKRLAVGDRVYDYGAGQYLVASLDLPVTGHFTRASAAEPALGFGLLLRPAVVTALLLEAGGWAAVRRGGAAAADDGAAAAQRPFGVTSSAPAALGVADADAELLDAVVRMVRLLDADPVDRAVLAPLIERELLWRLVTGPLGRSVAEGALADGTVARIGRAVEWINEHYGERFEVAELARRCGMSSSAFHRAFQAVTALSPIQFQKQVRLQHARLLLLAGAEDAATAGFRVGYDSASQFSREYRRQFGLPPGRDAARMRATAVA